MVMIASWVLLGMSVVTTPPPLQGVVRVVVGETSVSSSTAAAPIAALSGDLVRSGATLETGRLGWLELLLIPSTRIRVSSSTQIRLEGEPESPVLLVGVGRVWFEATGSDGQPHTPWTARASAHRLKIPLGTSLVIDRTRSGPTTVVVAQGEVSIERARTTETLSAGQAATLGSGPPRIRRGGEALVNAVRTEAADRAHDLSRFWSVVLKRIENAELRIRPLRGESQILRTDAEVLLHPGSVGSFMETALRPPPFFTSEIPVVGAQDERSSHNLP